MYTSILAPKTYLLPTHKHSGQLYKNNYDQSNDYHSNTLTSIHFVLSIYPIEH